MNINKKDIVSINIEIGESGELQNPGSLEFALGMIKQKKSWLYELSYLVRSMLVDHAFIDGNKRTSLALVLLYLDDKGMECDKQKIVQIIHKISKKSFKDINKIMRLIKSGISC